MHFMGSRSVLRLSVYYPFQKDDVQEVGTPQCFSKEKMCL